LLPGEETEFTGELFARINGNIDRYLPYAQSLPKVKL
jgi:hypothetical protein